MICNYKLFMVHNWHLMIITMTYFIKVNISFDLILYWIRKITKGIITCGIISFYIILWSVILVCKVRQLRKKNRGNENIIDFDERSDTNPNTLT